MTTRQERSMVAGEAPEEFRLALTQIAAARMRAEVEIEEMPAPQRIAPHATALAADVVIDDEDMGGGRLVVLHDPAGNEAWGGTFRCVAYVRADVEPEQVTDPMMAAVGWSWLIEALETAGAEHLAPSGTLTCVSSESFGGLESEGATAQLELRASWTPVGDLTPHVEAWGELMCVTAGLEPVPDGVAVLPSRPTRLARRRD